MISDQETIYDTSKFYPSRHSSKMIAAMKTNKTHTYTLTQSQIRHTQRKREKNDRIFKVKGMYTVI